jgi:hypothetical protein
MEALFQNKSKLNDPTAPEIIEKVNQCRADQFSAQIKAE